MAWHGEAIVVACAADPRYAMPLAVMVRSILANLGPGRRLDLFVIDAGLGERLRRKVSASWDPGRMSVRWIPAESRGLGEPRLDGHVSIATYYRLLLPDLLPPAIDRVIYLDCDLVVEADLGRLWETDLGGCPLAAAQDLIVRRVDAPAGLRNHRELGLVPGSKYFNAGVLLIDLARWRFEGLGAKVLRYLAAHRDSIRWWDQDALNAVLADRWHELDPRWNLCIDGRESPRPEELSISSADWRELLDRPYITHFLTETKPWHADCVHPRKETFFHYLDETRWAGWRPRRYDLRGIAGRAARRWQSRLGRRRDDPSFMPVDLRRRSGELLADLVEHGRRLLLDASYRSQRSEWRRLHALPRRTPGESTLLGRPFRFVDVGSFLFAYRQIFLAEIYRFATDRPRPRILDCGANVGLSVVYFKRLHPGAEIIAFEPDPTIFETLEWNVHGLGLADVRLVNAAVWVAEGEAGFVPDGADAGRLLPGEHAGVGDAGFRVPIVRLRDFLDERPVDLLKLDVEGSETEILEDCRGHLGNVERVFVEVHSFVDREQRLDDLLRVLRAAGFRLHLQPELVARSPFHERTLSIGMDQRLNVFAFRIDPAARGR